MVKERKHLVFLMGSGLWTDVKMTLYFFHVVVTWKGRRPTERIVPKKELCTARKKTYLETSAKKIRTPRIELGTFCV